MSYTGPSGVAPPIGLIPSKPILIAFPPWCDLVATLEIMGVCLEEGGSGYDALPPVRECKTVVSYPGHYLACLVILSWSRPLRVRFVPFLCSAQWVNHRNCVEPDSAVYLDFGNIKTVLRVVWAACQRYFNIVYFTDRHYLCMAYCTMY